MTKMEGTSSTDYTEYIRKYNDLVADVKKIGTDAEILEKLFNAKFIGGLNKEVFVEQLRSIYGRKDWPPYRPLQEELTRYINASKGMADSGLLKKDNPDGIQVNTGRITGGMFRGACFNCGGNTER